MYTLYTNYYVYTHLSAIIEQLNKLEMQVQKEIAANDRKMELLTGQCTQPEIIKATNVVNIIGKKKGFGAILANIRQAKQDKLSLPPVVRAANLDGAANLCELIDEFYKLPRIYPSKPKKRKPAVTDISTAQYEERKKRRELAMQYGTRSRVKRVQHLCTSLTDIYLQKEKVRNITSHMTGNKTRPLLK